MFAHIFQVYPMGNTNGKIQKQKMKCMHIGLFLIANDLLQNKFDYVMILHPALKCAKSE
jgi:hypothetical protein